MSRLAVRAAVPFAHLPLVSIPVSRTATPHPATIHQPTWLASAKPSRNGPCSADSTAEPATATPSTEPTCLLVDATAAATPACALGMPDTAVFVIGALTRPNPMPKTT